MQGDDDLSRIGVSLPEHLLGEFDEILKCRGYTSRSEGIRDAIRIYNTNDQWRTDTADERKGVLTVIYDFRNQHLLFSVHDILLNRQDLIRSSLRRYISKNRCLEILLVQGGGTQIKELLDHLMALKALEMVKLTVIPLELPVDRQDPARYRRGNVAGLYDPVHSDTTNPESTYSPVASESDHQRM
ncbi:ribbon-helix-helix protein, CopG family [Methanoregula sp.]|uniref:ribbon-helix-helix protein, CopG family n=1 Tax=Methanoregula sp. TaxID=2052170 RepID=UPI000CB9DF1E|nr:MAG: nickel-responsive transcriptional regulator NikR [Methanoregula sp.]